MCFACFFKHPHKAEEEIRYRQLDVVRMQIGRLIFEALSRDDPQ